MIVDYYRGSQVLFDGTNYIPIKNEKQNYLFGQDLISNNYLIDIFVCIIHFSSPHKFTIPGKKDIIRRESSSLINHFPKILTKTTKINQQIDMYAIVKIEKIENNIMFCEVCPNGYLGEVGDFNVENRMMEYVCTCHWKKSKKIVEQFLDLKSIDLTPSRLNLCDTTIYSIDPPGCLDIDDALHCSYNNETKEYEIGIHIADVSSFIPEDSVLNEELGRRVETVYDYKKKPIHMIPEELSIEHISLLEKKQKRAFSIILKLNENCDIIAVDFKKTLIMVTKNLTYDEAQNMITSDENIKNLYDVGLKLKSQIINAFPDGEIYDTHQMVAVYMIFANKLVGEKIQSFDCDNVLLRVHKSTIVDIVLSDNINPILLQKNSISNMEQAKYQIGTQNCSHSGLDLGFYTHMTSPIRRYADIIVHRQLWKVLNEIKLDRPNIKFIFMMNFYKKLFKIMERYMHVSEIAESLGTSCLETNAYITSINEDRESLRIFIPELDLDYDLKLIHNKMKSIMTTEYPDEYSIVLKNRQEEGNGIKYSLFQRITIKIVSTREPFMKLLIEIM